MHVLRVAMFSEILKLPLAFTMAFQLLKVSSLFVSVDALLNNDDD